MLVPSRMRLPFPKESGGGELFLLGYPAFHGPLWMMAVEAIEFPKRIPLLHLDSYEDQLKPPHRCPSTGDGSIVLGQLTNTRTISGLI